LSLKVEGRRRKKENKKENKKDALELGKLFVTLVP